MATEKESKLEAGVPKSKLKVPPNNCIPSRAKMRMKRKRRRRRETMDFMEASSETTRFLREDQYLQGGEVKCAKFLLPFDVSSSDCFKKDRKSGNEVNLGQIL